MGLYLLPILLPLNYFGGRGQDVKGLDLFAWGNVRSENTNRYWVHLILALLVICWTCFVFFIELRHFVRIRQDYLTSAGHRLRASATTVLVSSIPREYRNEKALRGLYNVYPGGIRNVWLIRDLAIISEKIKRRTAVCFMMERALTDMIRKANKAHKKNKAATKQDTAEQMMSVGDPLPHTIEDVLDEQEDTQRTASGRRSPQFSTVWQVWKAPEGESASPIPTGFEEGKPDGVKSTESVWIRFKKWRRYEVAMIEYPVAHNENYDVNAADAVWRTYLKDSERPTHRLAEFDWMPAWIPGIPLINEKVDTINWCRAELARLNVEIEADQKSPERFPVLPSAFIQFNQQVAAHMACQCVSHQLPQQMTPKMVEISPNDVIWENMAINWWQSWARTAIVAGLVTYMVLLFTVPVAWTATLAELPAFSQRYKWLHWLSYIPNHYLQAIAGVLPTIALSILLSAVPTILDFLALQQGARTGSEKQAFIQNFYFVLLFFQVFLVVSVWGGITSVLVETTDDVTSVLAAPTGDITSIPSLLADDLPKVANYFFSYMILQGLSNSSATLLQFTTLIAWFIVPKLFDTTARRKWSRETTLQTIHWGTSFPIYTNFACIAIIYSVAAPLIIVFAIITFSLLYVAQRYNMVYVVRFEHDTGGMLYPRAINQTFTGLYMMELLMVGLFLLVRDQHGNAVCTPQAIIMIVAIFLTILYQYQLNASFGPLFRHLPITLEDAALIRDRDFERAQARRLGGVTNAGDLERGVNLPEDIEMSTLTPAAATSEIKKHRDIRRRRRHKDGEAQKKLADALYGDVCDKIEDLGADQRNILVQRAFMHPALRERRPTVWIPRDDIGVSDDEIMRMRAYGGKNIWISNVGASLDDAGSVTYDRNPPDFSEIDIINL
jgi:hypothetical protein